LATVVVGSTASGATDSLTITLENSANVATDANGTLSGTGLTKIGVGTYALAATTPTALTSELQALVFTPTQHEVAPGKTVTTEFVLTATQTVGTIVTSTTNANASVVVTALNYIYGPPGGHGEISIPNGENVVTAYGKDNVIVAHGGADFINAGSGDALIFLDGTNATITLGGSGNEIFGGSGNVTVTGGSGGYNAVLLGNGNDVVQVGGMDDLIELGNGNKLVSGTQGMAFISVGSGNNTIVLGGSQNDVIANQGTNTITDGTGQDYFLLPRAGHGFDTITGFTETKGDQLDLSSALSGTSWNGSAATLANYLKVTSSGGNTTLAIAANGSGGGTAIAELMGAGNLTLANLQSSHSVIT
jgi:Ca2+-binding RTX toxin-like protein